jgi:uncharacterized protein
MGEVDQASLRRRLARLGSKQSSRAAQAVSPSPVVSHDPGISDSTSLDIQEQSETGLAAVVEKRFPLNTRHGHTLLGDIHTIDHRLGEIITGLQHNECISPERMIFLDTETTGLAGGAGTLAFLVGVGFIQGEDFILRQYFLRSPGEEASMLKSIEENLQDQPVFVTYNGKTFDLPLLETRALVGLRRRWRLNGFPHIDLLHLTRRMWRQMLPDCRLGTIESHLLGVKRTGEDIPGHEIPAIYQRYLQTGRTGEIKRVLYHNEIDILSLLALLVQFSARFSREDFSGLEETEVLALARWYENTGEKSKTEQAYQQALVSSSAVVRVEGLRHYSTWLKRAGLVEQAHECWREWSELDAEDPRPCVELAKYFEWRQQDFQLAQQWAQAALICLSHWPPGIRRAQAWTEIEHRLKRLALKNQS